MTASPIKLATLPDMIDLATFAKWLRFSEAIAKEELASKKIVHHRIGSRGVFRIVTASVAEVYGVPFPKDNDVPSEAVIAKPQLIGNAVVSAISPEGVTHARE
jgi:hypothetical protein